MRLIVLIVASCSAREKPGVRGGEVEHVGLERMHVRLHVAARLRDAVLHQVEARLAGRVGRRERVAAAAVAA